MSKKLDISGQRYGRLLTVSGPTQKPGSYRTYWTCVCDCGRTTSVATDKLRAGKAKSCGCYRAEALAKGQPTHGLSRVFKKEYKAWKCMKDRCLNPNNQSFKDYGARGVSICNQWLSSFEQFLNDMGPKPTMLHSIERSDNDGPYNKDNCFWATRETQSNNKRSNRVVYVFGEKLTLSQAVQKYSSPLGIKYGTVQARLNSGWAPEVALTSPVNHNARRGSLEAPDSPETGRGKTEVEARTAPRDSPG